MTNPFYQRILVPVDGSATADAGLDEAIRLARATGAQLRALHVVDTSVVSMAISTGGVCTDDIIGALDAGGQDILKTAKARAAGQGVTIDTKLHEGLGGRIWDIVNAEAIDWRADLIVIGSHGRRGISRLALGSDAEHILRHAEIPVLVVRCPSADASVDDASVDTRTLATA